jgi:hypothetical protein
VRVAALAIALAFLLVAGFVATGVLLLVGWLGQLVMLP